MPKIEGVTAYPLVWPVGWQETPAADRRRSAYKVPPGRARDDLFESARLLGVREVVLSTNQRLGVNGQLYTRDREPDDPGAAVYWTDAKSKKPRVMACDRWKLVFENVRALGLAIDAMRALERSGASQVFERAFDSFGLLPAAVSAAPSWRVVLGFSPSFRVNRKAIEDAWKDRAKLRHPDVGGTAADMILLNDAKRQALEEIERGY